MLKTLFLLVTLVLFSCSNYSLKVRSPSSQSDPEKETYYSDNCIEMELNEYNKNPYQLSKSQTHAIFYYTLGGFVSMNSSVADKSKCDELAIELVDNALDSIPNIKATVYRGDTTKYEKLNVDKVITVNKLMSTSTSEEVAENFVKDRYWTIKVVGGKDIKYYSNAVNENEILIPKGTKLKINKIQVKNLLIYPEGPGEPENRKVEYVWATEVSI